jgi:hypothetical protein
MPPINGPLHEISFVFLTVRVHGPDPGGGYGEPGDGGAARGGAPRPRRQHCGGQLLQRTHDCLHARLHTGNAVVGLRTRLQFVVGLRTLLQIVVGLRTRLQFVVGLRTLLQIVVGLRTLLQIVVGLRT